MQIIDHSKLNAEKKEELAKLLKKGGLGSWKTDTLYGYFCRFDAIGSINRILSLKRRSVHHNLSIAFDSFEKYSKWFSITMHQKRVLSETLPGPYTYILELQKKLHDSWFKNYHYIGIRVPDHELTLELCALVGIPLVATSANISSRKDATCIEEIPGWKRSELEFIIDSGKITKPVASTVIKFEKDSFSFVRSGVVTEKMFNKIWESSIEELDK